MAGSFVERIEPIGSIKDVELCFKTLKMLHIFLKSASIYIFFEEKRSLGRPRHRRKGDSEGILNKEDGRV